MFIQLLSIIHLFYSCWGYISLSKNDGKPMKPFICGSGLKSQPVSRPSSELAVRSFLLNSNNQWPRGYVPYEIDSTFSKKQVEMILHEMKRFTEVSCVRWVRRHKQRDYIRFIHFSVRDQCSSAVGRLGGKQTINLGDDCFDVDNGYRGAILHEMMHAIGFIHEQQRLDRDCYVRVSQRVVESRPADYAIRRDTSVDFPYDFGSIMHYGENEAMTRKNGKMLGNFKGEFTEMDIMKLNFMYCKGKSFCQLKPRLCSKFQQAEQKCTHN